LAHFPWGQGSRICWVAETVEWHGGCGQLQGAN
jgi:hypothetical protein